MKKQLLTFAILSLALAAPGQTGKGNFLISGDISYSHKTTKSSGDFYVNGQSVPSDLTSTINSISFNPKVGYFIIRNLCVGLSLPMIFLKHESSYSPPATSHQLFRTRNINVGPFIRYYIPLRNNFFVLTEASYARGRITYLSKYGYLDQHTGLMIFSDSKSTWSNDRISAGAGLAYLFNPSIGMELIAEYQTQPKTNYNYDLSLQLGFQIYLSK